MTKREFKIGDRVVSEAYGEGTVQAITDCGKPICVVFDGTGFPGWFHKDDAYSHAINTDGRKNIRHLEEKPQPKFKAGDTVYWPGEGFCTLQLNRVSPDFLKAISSKDITIDHSLMPDGCREGDIWPSILTLAEAALLGIKPPKKKVKKTGYYAVFHFSGPHHRGAPIVAFPYDSEEERQANIKSCGGKCIDTFERTVEVEVDDE